MCLQANGDLLYDHMVYDNGGSLCGISDPGASVHDCSQAVAQLQGNNTQCVVPQDGDFPASSPYNYGQVTLAVFGNCSISLGGPYFTALPCSTAAMYAQDIATACSTADQTTSGDYPYPGWAPTQDHFSPKSVLVQSIEM